MFKRRSQSDSHWYQSVQSRKMLNYYTIGPRFLSESNWFLLSQKQKCEPLHQRTMPTLGIGPRSEGWGTSILTIGLCWRVDVGNWTRVRNVRGFRPTHWTKHFSTNWKILILILKSFLKLCQDYIDEPRNGIEPLSIAYKTIVLPLNYRGVQHIRQAMLLPI